MPDQLQLRGGTTVQHSTFTGASKEVTVDTTKKTVVVHDGSTAGGNPMLREDASNSALALGSAGTPSLKFTGDTNTGIYSPGADQVAISTNGVGRLFVNASGQVGIGNASPNRALAVNSADAEQLVLTSTAGSLAGILFNPNGSTYTPFLGATGESLVAHTQGTERLRITSAGRVGIGTSSPSSKFHVADGDILISNSYYLLGRNNANTLSLRMLGRDAADNIIIDPDGYGVKFGFGGSTLVTTSAGRVGIGTTPTSIFHVKAATNRNFKIDSAGGGGGDLRISALNDADSANVNLQLQGDQLFFAAGGAERARIDSSGRWLLGTSSARANFYNSTESAAFQVEGIGSNRRISVIADDSSGAGAGILLGAQRSNAVGGNTIVANNSDLGTVTFQGNDGTEFVEAACITAQVDGTPGANDMPGRLVFSTTADGASSPTERMKIYGNGAVAISSSPYLYPVTDNATKLGLSGYRWSEVWAANGTIQTSDKRTKTNIANATLGSDFIKSLRPVSYKWIEGGKRDTGKRDENNNYIYESVPGERTHWGFIAQEVKEATDAAGVDFGGWILTDKDDPDSQQALRYDQFIAPLTKALQEALTEIDVLKAKVAALESA